MRSITRTALLIVFVLGLAGSSTPVMAEHMTSADLQRLQDAVFDIGGDIARLRGRDANLAARLQTDLDEMREEVIYLKVKMRKEGSVDRSLFVDLERRLHDLRDRARGEITSPTPTVGTVGSTGSFPARPAPAPGRPNEVPAGTEIDVRLQTLLSSDTAQVEDRFEATTAVDLMSGNNVLIPAGSVLRGVVTSVDDADRLDRKGRLTLSFDQIQVRGRSYPIRGTVTQALESEGVKGEAGRIGTGAGVGAIIGGILGGFKGALAGILIGGGGVIAATEGKDVELPAGTILRVRLDTPVVIR